MWVQLWLFQMTMNRTRIPKPKSKKQVSLFDDLDLVSWTYSYWWEQ